MKKSIAELRELFRNDELTEERIDQLRSDERKGVQAIINSYEKKKQKEEQLKKQFVNMQAYEHALAKRGFRFIAGVDEAGRGPLAGPVVAASVILPSDFTLYGLTDSKQLNEKQRLNFYHTIKEQAITYNVSIIDNLTIDRMNIFEATKLAMIQSLKALDPQPDHSLIDAVKLTGLNHPTTPIIKGDQKSVSIAAASIIAKVTRDLLMKEIHKEFPSYDFKSNMGYGTKHHVEQIKERGITPYHRKSFAPVKEVINYQLGW